MTVRIERVLKIDVDPEEDFGAPFFDNGPGYKAVQVGKKPGFLGRLPGRFGEQELTLVGGSGRMSLARATEIANRQAERYGGNWVVREAERVFP